LVIEPFESETYGTCGVSYVSRDFPPRAIDLLGGTILSAVTEGLALSKAHDRDDWLQIAEHLEKAAQLIRKTYDGERRG